MINHCLLRQGEENIDNDYIDCFLKEDNRIRSFTLYKIELAGSSPNKQFVVR